MDKTHAISIFSSYYTPRLRYAMYIVFELLLGLKVEEYDKIEDFKSLKTPKINYSSIKIDNSFHIEPDQLLFDDKIQKINTKHIFNENQIPLLFPTNGDTIDFDPFAAAFYIVSRYEEYNNDTKDKHDRFSAVQSIQYQLNCLDLPIVQVWARLLQDQLKTLFPSLSFSAPSFHYIPSFDIDMAWSYKRKGMIRSIGGFVKDLASLRTKEIQERLKVHTNLEKDPFDQFAYIISKTQEHNLRPIFFFLMGKYSDYDKNIRPDDPNFIMLIKEIAWQFQTGIHPSYYYKENLEQEIILLKEATEKEVSISRQHYIKLEFPHTYRLLIAQQIKADYSMGFPDKVGYRNGLAVPSLWYDLENEEMTSLMVHPFQVMDVTLKNYLTLHPDQAIEIIKNIVDTTAKYGGTMISIWHNSSFDKDWVGWQKVFEEMLSYSSKASTIT